MKKNFQPLAIVFAAAGLFLNACQSHIVTPPDELMSKQSVSEEWHARGRKFLSSRQYKEAIEAFTKAIEINPGNGEAYKFRGDLMLMKGDLDQAVSDYTDALEINPRNAQVYNNRGFV